MPAKSSCWYIDHTKRHREYRKNLRHEPDFMDVWRPHLLLMVRLAACLTCLQGFKQFMLNGPHTRLLIGTAIMADGTSWLDKLEAESNPSARATTVAGCSLSVRALGCTWLPEHHAGLHGCSPLKDGK